MRTNRWTQKAVTVSTVGAALDVTGGCGFYTITGSAASKTITSITNGSEGQWIILIFADTNVVITTAAANLNGAANFGGAAGDVIFIATADGTNWYEAGRSRVAGGTSGPITATTLVVSGATQLNGGVTCDTSAFTIADTSGNVATTGTLTVGGAAALNGGISVDTSAFTVADTSGNVATAGTLQVTGITTPTGGIAAAGGFSFDPKLIHTGGAPPAVNTEGSDATPVATEVYYAQITIPANASVTGVSNFNGSVASGNIKVGLANSAGVVVATSASTAMVGTDAYQRVPFTAPYAAKGLATYYVLLFVDNNTARVNCHTFGDFIAGKQTGQVFATGFTTITPGSTFTTALGPIASLY